MVIPVGVCKRMLLVISSPNLPTPPPDYFHRKLVEDRMEAWRPSLRGFLKTLPVNHHYVTLISARGSSAGNLAGGLPSNLNIIETIEPSWEGMAA